MTYNEATIEEIWAKGRAMPDHDHREWRVDECGAWMRRVQYESAETEFAWKIVNTAPDGTSRLDLRPFHARNTYDIAKGAPYCRVTADRTDQMSGEHIVPPRNRDV